MKQTFWALILFLLIGGGIIWYIQHSSFARPSPLPTICCTTSIITQVVQELTKNHAHVVGLMGPGIDPHLYKPHTSDIHKLSHADIILYNGLHLEGKMNEILSSLTNQGKYVYAVAENIPKEYLRTAGYADIYDPHIWSDIKIWYKAVENLSLFLQNALPQEKEYIDRNTKEYLTNLEILDTWIHEQISTIPASKRILITAHDAFAYFGQRYGLQVEGLQGISTDAEIRMGDIERVAQTILTYKIPTIFIEQTISEKYLQGVKDLVGRHGHKVAIGKQLYSDALGYDTASTYIGMIKSNVESIVQGLTYES